MTTEEIITTLKTALAEVEWEYSMDYAAAIDEGIKALQYVEFMSHQHSCNDCGWKTCKYKPKWGEPVRINCYQWRAEDQHSMEPKKAENGSKTCILLEKTHDRTTYDLINRRKAIQAIRERADSANTFSAFWEGLIIAISIVNGLPASPISPTQMPGTWISVDSDTKPENGDYVVVRYNCPVPPAVVEYRNEGFFDPYEGETVNAYGINVVDWMPLPKEDKNDDGMETGINTASR